MTAERIRLVIFQDAPSAWVVHGLEHDILAQGRTIGSALRAAVRFIEVQTLYDLRHGHRPLSTFGVSPQRYWNAYMAGTPIPLAQLGIATPPTWEVQAAFGTSMSGRNAVSSPMTGRNAQTL
ncbi:MAG TPA: hypothetical protein VFA59_05925 [Vicinamibacterales bacterium]|nr:hypothetical protein [Vicinamibacterales bacterium]